MARFLALDWDQNQLHVIAADVRAGTVHVRRALVWSENRTPNPAEAEDMGKLLRERLKEAGISAAPVLACLGRDRIIFKEVRFPNVPEAEEPAIVRFQAVKELTEAAEDVVIDYMITGSVRSTLSTDRKAAALVVRREVLNTYKAMCEAAGLKLAALTPRLMGANACLRKVMGTTVVTPPPDPANGVISVVVLGEKQAEISIVHNGAFLLARSLPVGPELAAEIRRNLIRHSGQTPQAPVVAVYLAGKGSGELRERVAELVEVPVHTFDPFAGSETIDLPVGNRGTFAGAMGLLQIKSAGEMPINFVAPREPKPQVNPNYRLIRLGLVAAVTLFVGLIVLGQLVLPQLQAQVDERKADVEKLGQTLAQRREHFKKLKSIDDWDNPVWLDELYNLNALIPDVNALRVNSISVEPLPRNAKLRAAAKVTVKVTLLDRRNQNRALDQLVEALKKDGYYSPTTPRPGPENTYELVYQVERRGPDAYAPVVIKEVEKANAGKAGFGGGRGGFFGGFGKGKGDKAGTDDEAGAGEEEDNAGKATEASGKMGKGKAGRGKAKADPASDDE